METKLIKVDSLDEAIIRFKEETDKIKAQQTVTPALKLCIGFKLFGYDVELCLVF